MNPSGWDYNLTKFHINFPLAKGWTVAVQSEKDLGVPCPEPKNQSFIPNLPGSPVTLNRIEHTDDQQQKNWTVNLKTDLHANTHPCGADYFTWYVFMDHADHGGGPLPRPGRVLFSLEAAYNHWLPAAHSRGIVGFQGFWNGKAHLLELSTPSPGWGDKFPSVPQVIDYFDQATLEFVNASAQRYGVHFDTGQPAKLITIDWKPIMTDLAGAGHFTLPSDWNSATTTAIYVGHELHNLQPTQAGVADIWFTNWRVEEGPSMPT